jgi:hypothetical protein
MAETVRLQAMDAAHACDLADHAIARARLANEAAAISLARLRAARRRIGLAGPGRRHCE